MAGASTELYSEVLAQICLAYAIKNNKALTKTELISGSTLNPNVVREVNRLMITQSTVNLSSQTFASGFIQYIRGDVVKGLNWVDAQGRNMLEVKRKFGINNGYRVYNDKLFGNTPSDNNPYSAFLKAGTGAKTDKWNPADIWVINLEGRQALKRLNRRVKARSKVSLEYANQFLAEQFRQRNIIPISLKKPQRTPHIEIVNSNEFVTRLVLGETSNATIEYDYGNKDVKINFTIETIQLASGQKASSARRNPNSIRGTVVQGSQKHIRLKYHVDNKKIELEYAQTGGYKYAEAKMGNLGAANFQNIINSTSKQGVSKLNKIQTQYDDIDIKTNPWFNGRQLGVTKARNEVSKIQPHYDRLSEYVEEIWREINGSAPDFASDKTLRTADGMWSKARAGELGLSIDGISNERIKKRVIQNLYEAAASISYVTGLNKEEMELEKEVGMDPSPRKTNFNASVYVKVY
jgi:hypothetical protein